MIINRKRGIEIDYLVFSIFRYKFWVTKSKYANKYPRLVIWEMVKGKVKKTWSVRFG